MNIFFVMRGELVTPPLAGTILPGITRRSVLEISSRLGIKASERRISIDEVIDASRSGELDEAFGSGTACVISPVGMLHYKNRDYVINKNEIGPVSNRMYEFINGVQYGEREDTFGWLTYV